MPGRSRSPAPRRGSPAGPTGPPAGRPPRATTHRPPRGPPRRPRRPGRGPWRPAAADPRSGGPSHRPRTASRARAHSPSRCHRASATTRPGTPPGSAPRLTSAQAAGHPTRLDNRDSRGVLAGLSPARRRLVLAVVTLVALAGVLTAGLVVRAGSAGSSPGPADERPGPVLLVPGYGGSTASLGPLADLLTAAGRDTTVVDLPGDGTGDLNAAARALGNAAGRRWSGAGRRAWTSSATRPAASSRDCGRPTAATGSPGGW